MTPREIAAVIFALLVFVVLMLPLRGGFTDDGYIHIQYAHNIIERGEYSFNSGEVSHGTTSPLWVIVQAALGRVLGGGETLISTSRVLSWLSGLFVVILVFFLGRAVGLTATAAWLCSLVFATHAWFVRWTALSMETSSAVLAIVAVGLVSVRAYEKRKHAWLLGFFMAIAALLRPEAYLLVPVYVVTVLLYGDKKGRGCVARTLLVYAALILPWIVFAGLHIGKILPNTAGAKSGGLIFDPIVFLTKFKPIAKITGSTEGLFVLLIVIALVSLRTRSRILTRNHLFMLLWVVALPVAYVLFDIQVLSRYMLLVTPFTVVLGFAALEDLLGGLRPRTTVRTALVVATAAVVVTVNVVIYFSVVLAPSKAFSHDLTHNLKRMALFIKDNSRADAVIAAADIGYLAFYSQRYVLDLGGLVLDATQQLREETTYEEIVERGMYLGLSDYPRVDFFIDREKVANRFDGRSLNGYRFESVRVEPVDNLGIRKPGPYYYTLYRLHREDEQDSSSRS